MKKKKEKLKQSNLNFRIDIVNRDKWNEESIKDHQEKMIDWFINTFSLPNEFKNRNNWKTEIIEKESFTPIESDAGNIAEGNKPTELLVKDRIFKVKTWQDVFIEFLNHVKEESESNFQFILENQYELFKRDDVIIKWSKLKEKLDTNPELAPRYKTFDGKRWDKLVELKDNTFFVHISISASTCMSRIASIMEKLYMPKESVQIKLK